MCSNARASYMSLWRESSEIKSVNFALNSSNSIKPPHAQFQWFTIKQCRIWQFEFYALSHFTRKNYTTFINIASNDAKSWVTSARQQNELMISTDANKLDFFLWGGPNNTFTWTSTRLKVKNSFQDHMADDERTRARKSFSYIINNILLSYFCVIINTATIVTAKKKVERPRTTPTNVKINISFLPIFTTAD